MTCHVNLSGEYNIKITKSDGTSTETGWFKNLILNQGLNRLGGASPNINAYVTVGTGTDAPTVTQTSLSAPLASIHGAARWYSYDANPPYTYYYHSEFRFVAGAISANLSEIGVGWDSSASTNLFSRALIADDAGNPTTISVTSEDQLTVWYRISSVVPTDIGTGVFDISGTQYQYQCRPYALDQATDGQFLYYNAFHDSRGVFFYPANVTNLIPITNSSVPAGGIYAGIFVGIPYVPGSYAKTYTLTVPNAGASPAGGIGFITVDWGAARWQFLITPAIPKNNTNTLTLTFSASWGRA